MVELNLQQLAPAEPVPALRQRKPLGLYLMERGLITRAQLDHALLLQSRQQAPLGEILVSEGCVSRHDVLLTLSKQTGLQIADLEETPPSPDLVDLKPASFWLKNHVIPWVRLGPILLVATARPDHFDAIAAEFEASRYTLIPVLAAPDQVGTAISRLFSQDLARAAETRVDPLHSCRTWTARARTGPVAGAIALLATMIAIPTIGWSVLVFAAVGTLFLFWMLRLSGLLAFLTSRTARTSEQERPRVASTRQPYVSIMVPLYKETEIADALIQRLRRLTYPKALLDVILVLEEEDAVTRETLSHVDLPSWMRTVEVPELNGLTTKPRAMNYALDFCRGDLIGVWDAEDAPQLDQIEHVVDHFEHAPPDVVCLQGVLDYYNPRTSWRSRCFTIEYNSWFRVILPGIARLGLVVPLGGTTFFFRRDKLEELGAWDAHNVTEDADLGVRLYRAGYRTEMVDTTTFEEANFRTWPWVKQRSRWLKGFMVTYLVHMRTPVGLLRDLGLLRFLGVQAFFLGTLGQFLLAPVLWVFWLMAIGISVPLPQGLTQEGVTVLFSLFLAAELTNAVVGLVAVAARERRFLLPWVPTMILYYPLGVLAAYKALWELIWNPFFWDKTQHGQAAEEQLPS
nr:glycosyltransferase [uncultured Ruegeria sp.]